MPLRRTYRQRNTNNPKYNPVTSPNIDFQGGQLPGDNVHVNSPVQDGDTNIFGNWSWESPNAVNAIQKISAVTDIDDTQYYAVPNFREVHRSDAGAVAVNFGGTVPALTAYTTINAGWTQSFNYINANSFGASGGLTIVDAGAYEMEINGSIIATGGFITNCLAGLRIDATNSPNGTCRISAAAAASITQAPLNLKWISTLTAGQTISPVVFVSLSAGTAAVETIFWKIKPLYFA